MKYEYWQRGERHDGQFFIRREERDMSEFALGRWVYEHRNNYEERWPLWPCDEREQFPVIYNFYDKSGSNFLAVGRLRVEHSDGFDGPHVPYSRHYLCPVCGTTWAEETVIHAGTRHQFVAQQCIEHGGYGNTFWSIPGEANTELMPYELLEHEFLIIMKHKDIT